MRFTAFGKLEIVKPEPRNIFDLRMGRDAVIVSAQLIEGRLHIVHTVEAAIASHKVHRTAFVAKWDGLYGEDYNPCHFWCEVREPSGASTGLYLFEKLVNEE